MAGASLALKRAASAVAYNLLKVWSRAYRDIRGAKVATGALPFSRRKRAHGEGSASARLTKKRARAYWAVGLDRRETERDGAGRGGWSIQSHRAFPAESVLNVGRSLSLLLQ